MDIGQGGDHMLLMCVTWLAKDLDYSSYISGFVQFRQIFYILWHKQTKPLLCYKQNYWVGGLSTQINRVILKVNQYCLQCKHFTDRETHFSSYSAKLLCSVYCLPSPCTTIVVQKAGRDLAPQIMIVICYDLHGDYQCEAEPALVMFVCRPSLHDPSDGQTGSWGRTPESECVFQDEIEQCCITLTVFIQFSVAWKEGRGWMEGGSMRNSKHDFQLANPPVNGYFFTTMYFFVLYLHVCTVYTAIVNTCSSSSWNSTDLCTTVKSLCCRLKLVFWSQQLGEWLLSPV